MRFSQNIVIGSQNPPIANFQVSDKSGKQIIGKRKGGGGGGEILEMSDKGGGNVC